MKASYPAVARTIAQWISQNVEPGARLPSARTLAVRFSLKFTTAQRACAVLAAQGVLRKEGYKLIVAPRPSRPATLLPIQILSSFPWFTTAVAALFERDGFSVKDTGLDWANPKSTLFELEHIHPETTSAVVVYPSGLDGKEVALLQALSVPRVVCGFDVVGCPSVNFNIGAGVEMAIAHLAGHGHREIGLLLGLGWDLAEPYRRACLLTGLKHSARNIFSLSGLEKEWPREIAQVRQAHPEITAIFGPDPLCERLLQICSVPCDVSVVGWLDLRPKSVLAAGLTSVGWLEHERLATWAHAEILAQLRERSEGTIPEERHVRLAPKLFLRASTRALKPGKAGSVPPQLPEFRTEEVELTWRNVYPILRKGHHHDWQQIDLAPYVNAA